MWLSPWVLCCVVPQKLTDVSGVYCFHNCPDGGNSKQAPLKYLCDADKVSLKCWSVSTRLHSTSRKTAIFIHTPNRTWNLVIQKVPYSVNFKWYNVPKLTRGKKVVGPFLNIIDGNIKPWWYNPTFVQSATEVHNYFTRTVIINNFKFSNITCWNKKII